MCWSPLSYRGYVCLMFFFFILVKILLCFRFTRSSLSRATWPLSMLCSIYFSFSRKLLFFSLRFFFFLSLCNHHHCFEIAPCWFIEYICRYAFYPSLIHLGYICSFIACSSFLFRNASLKDPHKDWHISWHNLRAREYS